MATTIALPGSSRPRCFRAQIRMTARVSTARTHPSAQIVVCACHATARVQTVCALGADGLSCRYAQANVQAASKKGSTALKLANLGKHSKCVELLQKQNPSEPFERGFSLRYVWLLS